MTQPHLSWTDSQCFCFIIRSSQSLYTIMDSLVYAKRVHLSQNYYVVIPTQNIATYSYYLSFMHFVYLVCFGSKFFFLYCRLFFDVEGPCEFVWPLVYDHIMNVIWKMFFFLVCGHYKKPCYCCFDYCRLLEEKWLNHWRNWMINESIWRMHQQL